MKRKHAPHPYTAIINKAQKILSKEHRDRALKWMAQRFPEAFDNTQRIRPLKIGIMQDLLQHSNEAQIAGISRSKLRAAVVLFTRRLDYLICLKAQEMRIDLNGNPITPVTLEEADQARTKLKIRMEKSLRYKNEDTSMPSKDSTSRPISTAQKAMSPSNSYPLETNSVSSVLVKHKITRRYDPTAVARLKEKLGLSHEIQCAEDAH